VGAEVMFAVSAGLFVPADVWIAKLGWLKIFSISVWMFNRTFSRRQVTGRHRGLFNGTKCEAVGCFLYTFMTTMTFL